MAGDAIVVAIELCPPIAPGPGRVVLTTTKRYGQPVLALQLAESGEALELTPGHRLFSEVRADWVPAADLKIGEELRTQSGRVTLSRIAELNGLHTVFNLEVETDHCYFAGGARILSHNNSCAAGSEKVAKAINGNSRLSTKAQHAYEIVNTANNEVVKPGVSGGRRTATGGSYRANQQANRWNREAGQPGLYKPRIIHEIPEGPGARARILEFEREHARRLRAAGQLKDPRKHKKP